MIAIEKGELSPVELADPLPFVAARSTVMIEPFPRKGAMGRLWSTRRSKAITVAAIPVVLLLAMTLLGIAVLVALWIAALSFGSFVTLGLTGIAAKKVVAIVRTRPPAYPRH
jgi:hypothetical protein